jgi:hypothetical protein
MVKTTMKLSSIDDFFKDFDMPRCGIGVILCLFFAFNLNAEPSFCPSFVDAQREIKDRSDEGWAVVTKNEHIPLHHIEIFEGVVEKKASLIPDVEDDAFAVWRFQGSENGFWLGCYYDGGVVQLSKRLPNGVNECKVIYSPSARVAPNARQILSVQCK